MPAQALPSLRRLQPRTPKIIELNASKQGNPHFASTAPGFPFCRANWQLPAVFRYQDSGVTRPAYLCCHSQCRSCFPTLSEQTASPPFLLPLLTLLSNLTTAHSWPVDAPTNTSLPTLGQPARLPAQFVTPTKEKHGCYWAQPHKQSAQQGSAGRQLNSAGLLRKITCCQKRCSRVQQTLIRCLLQQACHCASAFTVTGTHNLSGACPKGSGACPRQVVCPKGTAQPSTLLPGTLTNTIFPPVHS